MTETNLQNFVCSFNGRKKRTKEEELQRCFSKLSNNTQLIDFFVRDFKDYCSLVNNYPTFELEEQVFFVDDAIKQVSELLSNDLRFFSVKVSYSFNGFPMERNLLRFDRKRLQ